MAKKDKDPRHFLRIAHDHLERVQAARDEPDWADLGTYGLYCVEALIRAAALTEGETPIRIHWGKADQARNLAKKHKLPDVGDLLEDLNELGKASAYGDVDVDYDDYSAGDIADEIDKYFAAVSEFCK